MFLLKSDWWKKYTAHWSAACKLILLVQPLSAAAERVLLTKSFSEQQSSALMEYSIEASIIIESNANNFLLALCMRIIRKQHYRCDK